MPAPDTMTRRTPVAVHVLGERVEVSSWRDVAEATCERILQMDEERFGEIVAQFPRFFSHDPTGFRASRRLSNGVHMMTHSNAAGLNRLCVQVTQAAGLSLEDWKVELD